MFGYEFYKDRIQGPLATHEMVGDLGAFASVIWIHGNPFLLQSNNKQFILKYNWQFHFQLNFDIHGPPRPLLAPVQCTGCIPLSCGLAAFDKLDHRPLFESIPILELVIKLSWQTVDI